MKEVYRCQWETIPGDGEHKEDFPTLAAAKQAMRQIIAESIDLKEYIADLDSRAAQFLNNYLSDPQFPREEADVPEEYEEPERGELTLNSGFITWNYPYDAYPKLDTTLVLKDREDGEYRFMFYYEYPEEATGNGVTELSITIVPHIDYGTSAYPLMIWNALREEPKTQEQIIRTISEVWNTNIERKAVGRNLELLKNLGYPVRHSPNGYYWGGDFCEPVAGVELGPGANPLLILRILDSVPKTQTAIIHALRERYGVKIGRQAVSRLLELLIALEFRVKKSKDGYSIVE